MRDTEHDEIPSASDYRCRRSWCANSRNPDRQAIYSGELCEQCEREAEREDAENPRCSVCEIRKDEHGEDFPCRYEDDSEETK